MSKKKNKNKEAAYSKTYIQTPKGKLMLSDLVDEVNRCDKSYGIRLKHPDIWADPQQYREIAEAKTEMNIAAIICILNGIRVKEYFETDNETGYGTICKPVGIMHPVFTDASILNWNSRKKYNTDSLIFRCRFLTLVLSQFLGRIDCVTRKKSGIYLRFKHSQDEQRIVLTKDIINDIVSLSSGGKFEINT